MSAIAAEEELIDEVASFDKDPLGYIQFAYPWGEPDTELENEAPREWQAEEFEALGKHLSNPLTRFHPYLSAIVSGHGIGKSAFIGMLTNWGMSTAEDCKIIVTANTDTQLRTKTWPEITKWLRLSITSHWFAATATAIHSIDSKHEKSWRADAIPWSKTNTEAFAGAHNRRKRIVIVFDEGSAIDDKIWEVIEGALTDEDTEIFWFVFGNPTRATGRFRECFRKFAKRWRNRHIDSREVEGTNKKQIAEWQKDHGEDSDFFKVRVRGVFPSMSVKQFISEVDADAGYGKHLREPEYNFAAKIICVDPAWEGDDEFVIGLRQGLYFQVLGRYPKNDNDNFMGGIIARFEDEHKADAVFVDIGWGAGIISFGRTVNRTWRPVNFAEASADPGCLNKRAEMWKLMRDWLKEGGAYPPLETMRQELMAPETVARVDGKLQLESKKDMKSRGVPSPNIADCLAISFAYPVAPKMRAYSGGQSAHRSDWDPLK